MTVVFSYLLFMSERKINQFFLPATPKPAKRQRSSSSPELVSSPDNASMSEDKVGELTQAQLMEGLSLLLDQKLANLATKEDVSVLTKRVEALKSENDTLREEIAVLKRKEQLIENRLVDLEARSRRNNLIFRGMKVSGNTNDYCQLVRRFCNDLLGTDDKLYVNRAHPLGRDRSTIIAHLPDDRDINYIMSKVQLLRNTGFVVHRDYPAEIRERRAKLAKVRAEVERVTGRRRMPLTYDHLTVEGCRFTWQGKLRAGAADGAERLQELVGQDFSEFLARLQQGDPEMGHRQPPTREMTPPSSRVGSEASAASFSGKTTQR